MIKQAVLRIDNTLLRGTLRNLYREFYVERRIVKAESKNLRYGFTTQYDKKDDSLLNSLCDRFGSDKGESSPIGNPYPWPSHSYADFYSLAFGLRRGDVERVVECGLGTNNPDLASSMGAAGRPGASLRVWQQYFHNAEIIGCDIDQSILFNEDRIKTYYCDQTSAVSIESFKSNSSLAQNSVDIIIDDGLHEFDAGITFFENMISTLTATGIYVIEDITPEDMPKYKRYFGRGVNPYEVNFIHLYTPSRPSGGSNRLAVIRKK